MAAEPTTEPNGYAELAELAGGFIHEIKNHLGTLGLNLQLLKEDFQEPQTQRERRALERTQRLQAECQRLVDLSNDFLRFARVKDLELVPGDLAAVIEEMIDFFGPMARQANIDIKCYLPADLPRVRLHPDLFKQALLNLMLNAAQAMPAGGELTIQARHEPGEVCLSLIDTGTGMGPEVLNRLFRPFFSTKPGGTGLGLATSRKIVRAHGGSLSVQSEVGRGTKFTIRLAVDGSENPKSADEVPISGAPSLGKDGSIS
jgi:two-component system, NtrC family, sensor histidine kinase HydH